MTDKSNETWQQKDEQIDKIILSAIQGIAQQSYVYINELLCPLEFITVMLIDVALTVIGFNLSLCLIRKLYMCIFRGL